MRGFKKLAFCLIAATVIHAQDAWTTGDTVRESVVVGELGADWLQTLQIENYPDRHELNRMLPRRPSRATVNAYFLASIGVHVLIADLLPRKWREAYQYLAIGFEASIIAHNYHVGISVKF